MIEDWYQKAQPTLGGAIPRQVVHNCVRKLEGLQPGSDDPVGSILPEFLTQFQPRLNDRLCSGSTSLNKLSSYPKLLCINGS